MPYKVTLGGHLWVFLLLPFLDLMLMDGGNGMTPSNESLGRVILSLAKHIEKTEAFLEDSNALVRFELHEERLLRYKDEGLT